MKNFVWKFLFLLQCNRVFAAKISDILCTNQTEVYPKSKLICENNANEANPMYYSCYHERTINADLSIFSTEGCQGATLDPTIPNLFKNLYYYIISNHSIESLSPDDLRFEHLETLLAEYNKLTFIPAGLFVHAPNLKEIDFSHNNITALDANAFNELKKLQRLFLTNNPIRYFDGKIMMPLHFRLDLLAITWENVEEFDVSHMRGVFDIGYGSAFDGFAFGKRKETLTSFSYVTKYYTHFESLQLFNASDSNVMQMMKIIEKFGERIEVLDLSSNSIEHFDASAFNRFKNLKFLNLSNTNLRSVDFNGFHNRDQLQVLDLSNNNLNEIDFAPSVGPFKALEWLNLKGTQVKNIDFGTSTTFPKLSTLEMSLTIESNAKN